MMFTNYNLADQKTNMAALDLSEETNAKLVNAVKNGKKDSVESLLNKGIDPFATWNHKVWATPLHCCADKNQDEIAKAQCLIW